MSMVSGSHACHFDSTLTDICNNLSDYLKGS